MIKGVLPALVTPFLSDDPLTPSIDWESWERLVEWQLESGVHGLVIFGTTGESATLSKDEKLELARRTVKQVSGRVPIIAGTGSNNTADSIALTREVAACGIDAVLAVTPYYNKPNQEGIYRHFAAIADQGGLPVVVYNVPGRTVASISLDTYRRLAQHPGIVACKQAVDSISELMGLSVITGAGTLKLLAGDDAMFFATLCCGGVGVISATASVFPKAMCEIYSSHVSGDATAALRAQQKLLPAIDALFSETNPAPAKAALAMLGIIAHESLRLPLVPVREQTRTTLGGLLGVI